MDLSVAKHNRQVRAGWFTSRPSHESGRGAGLGPGPGVRTLPPSRSGWPGAPATPGSYCGGPAPLNGVGLRLAPDSGSLTFDELEFELKTVTVEPAALAAVSLPVDYRVSD